MSHRVARPTSTYRLQFTGRFRFADALTVLPYLEKLGITACYSSPILLASRGSMHGYDICDHGRINPELGSEEEYAAWCAALQSRQFGHLVDFVPNHMSADPMANPWWRDVLENGPSSPYARFFDIDWEPVKPELKDKILLPLLGDQYGRVLERGDLQLRFDEGALHLQYFDHDLPINPRQSPRILEVALDTLTERLGNAAALREYLSILTALRNLPPYTEQDASRIAERQREKEVARERLARLATESSDIGMHIADAVRRANGVPGDRESFDLLHSLLEHQAYRLAYWRTAIDEINYRRFFDINQLVGLRVEEPQVFDETHRFIHRQVADRHITGLRIDHPDGLFDPAQYFARLQQQFGETRQDDSDAPHSLYVVAEKILSEDEELRADWPVAGTTGYRFLNQVSGLFVDGGQAHRLGRVYQRLTGRLASFDEVVYESKRTIMLTAMASELNVLAHALNRLSERDRRSRDFTLNSCRKVLREVVAHFPVYRTYVTAGTLDAIDRAAVHQAISGARLRNPLMEPSIFDFLERVLLPFDDGEDATKAERLWFAMKLQQFSGPVQAKGLEDTAFYRYNVLISANDVGGHPGRLGVTPAEFHDTNARRLERWPTELITTATHDTKRGEDARTRIDVLSEVPDLWHRSVSEWMRINARHRTKLGNLWAPDRNDEYLLYQALVGGWPASPPANGERDRVTGDFVKRLNEYLQKAAREAKVHTSWIDDDPAYARALSQFVEQALTGAASARFLRSFIPFQRRVARIGMVNSLAQVTLKLSSPGVSDFYQGNELWDLSFVDPDNRRDVDFNLRQQMLDVILPAIETVEHGGECAVQANEWLNGWEDGRIKLFITAAGLRYRRRNPRLLLDGHYVPLESEGPAGVHVVAFARQHETGTLVAIVPRLVAPFMTGAEGFPIGSSTWTSTRLVLPDALRGQCYRHVLTGETIQPSADGGVALADALRSLPVALLGT
jgi:(1->4)-alpha-D-glucan 1-alpha-D-glucosylmutase